MKNKFLRQWFVNVYKYVELQHWNKSVVTTGPRESRPLAVTFWLYCHFCSSLEDSAWSSFEMINNSSDELSKNSSFPFASKLLWVCVCGGAECVCEGEVCVCCVCAVRVGVCGGVLVFEWRCYKNSIYSTHTHPLATHHTPRPIHTHTSTHAHTRSTYITLPAPHTHLHTHTHSAPPNTLLPTLARTQYPSSSRVFKTFFTNNCYFFRLKIDVLSFHVNVIEWSFL